MKKHKIKVELAFEATIEIEGAESQQEALAIVKNDFGLRAREPYSTNSKVKGWEIENNPTKTIISIYGKDCDES